MGLFKRRDQTREELEAMRADMHTLKQRLEQTDAVKDRLAERLGHLDAENERLTTQVGTVEQALATPPPPPDDTLGNELGEVRVRLEGLADALQLQQSQIADVALVATDAAERNEQTGATVAELTATAAAATPIDQTPPVDGETRRQVGQLAEKVAALDSRVGQVSLELTNQLSELSSDLERGGAQSDTTELIDRINAQLDDITGGQERLANEQARYAIQFREDLAELADRLRKQR